MCGIAGIVRFNDMITEKDHTWMAYALHALRRRGPDAQQAVMADSSCLLGASRLRITDAQNRDADQPFVDDTNGNVIVFNGEVYNHRDLRKRLAKETFKTNSDTETLLTAYRVLGVQCFNELEGMFSYAIWNKQEQYLDICVDPTRQKPLFYVYTKKFFAFASDLEILLRLPGVDFSLNHTAIGEIITFRMNIAPDTIWKQIKKLSPGTAQRIGKDGQVQALRYHHVPLPDARIEEEALWEVSRKETEISCKETCTEEHHAAILLSGGVDSSVVAALLTQFGQKLSAISIGFEGKNTERETFNEFKYADLMAGRLGLKHTKVLLNANDYLTWFERWIGIAQEPFSSLEAICLHRIFHELSSQNIRVAYSGTGPDEMLDGYKLGQLIAKSPNSNDLTEQFFDRFSRRGIANFSKLMGEAFIPAKESVFEKLNLILSEYDSCDLTALEQVQIINTHVHLPEYEHRQMDFLSMHHSIEIRNPLCSKRLMNRWFNTTGENRTCPENEKWLWKKVAEKYVPHEIAWRKKRGFPVPNYVKHHPHFEAMMRALVEPTSTLCENGYINGAYLDSIREREEEEYRRVFFRLVLLNSILERQLALAGQPIRFQENLEYNLKNSEA